MQGGGRFVARLVPCAKLTASYQYEVVTMLINTLETDYGAAVIGIICDDNRLNQSFFKRFMPFDPLAPHHVCAANRPRGSMLLIYDPVHLVKNLKNYWITDCWNSPSSLVPRTRRSWQCGLTFRGFLRWTKTPLRNCHVSRRRLCHHQTSSDKV